MKGHGARRRRGTRLCGFRLRVARRRQTLGAAIPSVLARHREHHRRRRRISTSPAASSNAGLFSRGFCGGGGRRRDVHGRGQIDIGQRFAKARILRIELGELRLVSRQRSAPARPVDRSRVASSISPSECRNSTSSLSRRAASWVRCTPRAARAACDTRRGHGSPAARPRRRAPCRRLRVVADHALVHRRPHRRPSSPRRARRTDRPAPAACAPRSAPRGPRHRPVSSLSIARVPPPTLRPPARRWSDGTSDYL